MLAEYTMEELYVEYLEDMIDVHGGIDEFKPAVREIEKASEWGEKLDRGEQIDPMEGMDQAEKASLERFINRKAPRQPSESSEAVEEPPEGFSDVYGGGK